MMRFTQGYVCPFLTIEKISLSAVSTPFHWGDGNHPDELSYFFQVKTFVSSIACPVFSFYFVYSLPLEFAILSFILSYVFLIDISIALYRDPFDLKRSTLFYEEWMQWEFLGLGKGKRELTTVCITLLQIWRMRMALS